MGILGLLFGGGQPSYYHLVIQNKDNPMKEGDFHIYYCKDQNGTFNKVSFDGVTLMLNDKPSGVVIGSKPDGKCMSYIVKDNASGSNWQWVFCAGRIYCRRSK